METKFSTQVPCDPAEILSFQLNFENLQKFLVFINNNVNALHTKSKDIELKLGQIDEVKSELEQTNHKVDSHYQKFVDIDQSLNAHQNKLMEIEGKFDIFKNMAEEHSKTLQTVTEKLSSNDENLNNLNRVTEDSAKNLVKLEENIISVSKEVKTEIQSAEKKFEKEVETLGKGVKEEIGRNMKEFNARVKDSDSMMLKLMDNVNNLTLNSQAAGQSAVTTSQPELRQATVDGNSASQNLLAEQISRVNKQIDELKQKYDELAPFVNLKNAELKDEVLREVSQLKEEFESQLRPQLEETDENAKDRVENQMLTESDKDKILQSLPSDAASEEHLKRLKDSVRVVSQNLGYKANREDLSKMQKNFQKEIEKVNDNMKIFEKKLRGSSISQAFSPEVNNRENSARLADTSEVDVAELVTKLSTEIFEKQIIAINLRENNQFRQSEERVDANREDIDKVFQSLVDIRNNLLEGQPDASSSNEIKDRLLEVEVNMRKLRTQLDDTIRSLEGDPVEEQSVKSNKDGESGPSTGSLREYIRSVAVNQKMLSEKLDKFALRLDGMNAEILGKMKKDLQVESNRILDEFKQDLKSALSKINDQLREKVDRFNLDEFNRKIDSKFITEFSKKLDKNDLKKNNNVFNKKLDTLESKISKTLVDTLIDLQMDEAPLIVKKSGGGSLEKCASCNQVIQNQPHTHNEGPGVRASKLNPARLGMRDSSSNFQDSPDKRSVVLPDISQRIAEGSPKLTKKKLNVTQRVPKYEYDRTEQNFSSKINEELGKKIVNPDNLIRTANKAFDSMRRSQG